MAEKYQKTLFIDFEFNQVTEEMVNLVSVSWSLAGVTKSLWLHNNEEAKEEFRSFMRDGAITRICSYAAVAEVRSFLSLGIDPLKWDWTDLFFEYRCLSNRNDFLNYGEQLVNGKVTKVFKPKKPWELLEGESPESGFKPTHSLAEATYKLLGEIRDTEHKNKMRELIISDPKEFSEEDKKAILLYGEDDVKHLPDLLTEMLSYYRENMHVEDWTNGKLWSEIHRRGRYAVYTGLMENRGYPIDLEKTKNFSDSVSNILHDCQSEINQLFPDILPFKWKKTKFVWDQKITKLWVEENCKDLKWDRTEKGELSLSLEAWTKFFPFSHHYPKDSFPAQIVRFLKLKQNLNGFLPATGDKKTFWSSVGSDSRVRAYLNPYGAQSSRTQPSATGFLFLKPAWMRALVAPSKGNFLAGIDFGSQEFLVQALNAKSLPMIESYFSGDPYLWFGKQAGVIPQDGTKHGHAHDRDTFKSTTLGVSFGMTEIGLSRKLSLDTGRAWTKEQAKKLIDMFYSVYSGVHEYQEQVLNDYWDKGYLKLPCGWVLWGDNDNPRSVKNVPVQGTAASIMRIAVELAEGRGVRVIKTLHDAIYIEGKVGEEKDILVLAECMREATAWAYEDPEMKEYARKIRLDPVIWGPDYDYGTMKVGDMEVETKTLYIDERAKEEYDTFSKYFNKQDYSLV